VSDCVRPPVIIMPAPAKAAAPAAPKSPPGPLVLVVDDNPVIRQIQCRALTGAGFAVVEAPDGARALQLLSRDQPALVLLDLMMGDMDGFKFLDQLRKRSDGAALPVVVPSAKPLSDLEREYVTARAQGFVRKSDKSAAEVVALVRQLLAPPAA
jgi:CheY-like chemotaxis protein